MWKRYILYFFCQEMRHSVAAKVWPHLKAESLFTGSPLPVILWSPRSRRLVSRDFRPTALAPGGSRGADGSDGCGHTRAFQQPGLGQQLPAILQWHRPGLETAQTGGWRRGESTLRVYLTSYGEGLWVTLAAVLSCWTLRQLCFSLSPDGMDSKRYTGLSQNAPLWQCSLKKFFLCFSM